MRESVARKVKRLYSETQMCCVC